MAYKKSGAGAGATAPKPSEDSKNAPIRPDAAGRTATVSLAESAEQATRFAAVPADLRALPAWLVWGYGIADANGRRSKLPRYVGGGVRRGAQGSPKDRSKLASFDAAVAAVAGGRFEGIALAMLPEQDLTAFDFDHKKAPLSEAEVRALLPDCYIERSPSGKGFRAFVRGAMPNIRGGARGIEAFSASQFVTVTGAALQGVPSELGTLTDELRQRIESMAKKPPAAPAEHGASEAKAPLCLDIESARQMFEPLSQSTCDEYFDWLRVGMALHHEFGGSDEALALWDEWSQRAPDRYDPGVCAAKWATFGKPGKNEVTMRSVLGAARAAGWQVPRSVAALLAAAEFHAAPIEQHEAESDDDLASFALPQMPDAALYGVLRSVVDAATATSEATRPGVAAATLVHFAARFGKALGIDIGDERRTLPLFVLLVGPTGRGRKGTSSGFAGHLFDDLDALLALGWGDQMLAPRNPHVPPLRVRRGVSSGQGLIELVRDESTYQHRGLDRYVPGVEDKRILLDLSEFAQVFSASAQESSTLSMVLRDAFDARKLDSPSRNNPLEATGAHVTVLGHITMSEFRRRTVGDKRSTETQNGLLNRFCVLYSVRERVVSRPEPVPDALRRKLAGALANNVHAVFDTRYADHRSRRAVVLAFTDEARALWDVEYPRLTQQSYDTEILYEMMARRELITLTLAALLAAMNGESAVGVEALRAGLVWGQYMADTNARVFTTLAERRSAAELRGWVKKLRERLLRAGGAMMLREVRAAFNKTTFVPSAQDAAIRAMLEASPPELEVIGKQLRLRQQG